MTLSSEPRVDSLFEDLSVASWTIHLILPVELDHFLHSDFAILQFLGNLLCDFLGRAYSSFPILQIHSFSVSTVGPYVRLMNL